MPADDTSQRLFLALWPGSAAHAATLGWQGAQPWPDGSRLVARDKLHVTLHFLGAVAVATQSALLPALDRVPMRRVQLDFDRLALWQGGVAVLTSSATPQPLQELHADLGRALRSVGLVDEGRPGRPFAPHVTLARHATGVVAIERPPVRWIASRFSLVVSTDGRYRNLATFSARSH